jgi:hypothetical protein
MTTSAAKVRRILHFKFTFPSADPKQLLTMMQAAAPFYEMFGNKSVRLMQNVDDPSRFIQVFEYETLGTVEMNRQRIASDPALQAYLQSWRALLGGAVDVDVYQDVTGG